MSESIDAAVECFHEGIIELDGEIDLVDPFIFNIGQDIYCIQKVIVHEQH